MEGARSVEAQVAVKKEELLQYNSWAKTGPSQLEGRVFLPVHKMHSTASDAQKCDESEKDCIRSSGSGRV